MKRVLPAPLLSIVLLAMWLVLQQSLAPGDILLGAALAVAIPVLSAPLRPLPVRIRRPGVLLRLILAVGQDVVMSNLQVAHGVLHRRRRPPHGAFLHIPLDMCDANALAALAAIMTIIPGTIWSELAPDGSVLLLHVFDVTDEPAFIANVKERYERPLMEIFE